jgi:uncharacterized membrane protein
VLLPSANVAALLGVAFFILSIVHRLIGGSSIKTESPDPTLLSFFSTLWQVQAGIAGAALPFLLLVIEFSKDETYATLRSSEVLIRRTFIFPVTSIALAGAIKIGFDTLWYATPGMFALDLSIFVLTSFGTLYAYARAMQLMSSRTGMRREALLVLKERVGDSLDTSIDTRIGNNILFAELEHLPLEYKIFRPSRRESTSYVALPTREAGRLEDINLKKLERFLDGLPRRTPVAGDATAPTPNLYGQRASGESGKGKGVFLLARFRERVRQDERAVILLERAAFESLDSSQL